MGVATGLRACARRCDVGCLPGRLTQPVGGDADHLEELEDIDNTVAAGFAFFTLDPKAEVDPQAEHADPATIKAKVEALDWPSLESDLPTFIKSYAGQRIDLQHQAIDLDEESVLRAMAKYGPSLAHAMAMYRRLMEKGADVEVEFAVDETDYPTKPAEHVVVVSELKRLGMDFVSFAPRFVGRFEKGVEYIGDIDELQRDFEIHAAARALGPYKLSLHSGSEVFDVSPDRRGNQRRCASENRWHQLGGGAARHCQQRCRSDAADSHARARQLRGQPQELPPVLRSGEDSCQSD